MLLAVIVCNSKVLAAANSEGQFKNSNEKDFESICYMSGFEPEYVRQRYHF